MSIGTWKRCGTRPLVTAMMLTVALSVGCGKDEKGGKVGKVGKTPAATSPAAKKAKAIYLSVCTTCHGVNGKGDGPTAKMLSPKPRNYSDPFWQKSVTDADLKTIILEGGAKVGKSAVMPANPQLRDQPEVVDELVKIIRAFNAKKLK